ncbi:unnamed protein product, partial [marine sediment metagenome]
MSKDEELSMRALIIRDLKVRVEELESTENSYEVALDNCCLYADIDLGYSVDAKEKELTTFIKAAAVTTRRAERAEAVVAKLPKAADDVPVVPGMELISIHPVTGEYLGTLTVRLMGPESFVFCDDVRVAPQQ